MTKIQIMLSTIEDVVEFHEIMLHCPYNADLCVDRYTVNAKSIHGILSLNLKRDLELVVYTDELSENMEQQIKKFIVPY